MTTKAELLNQIKNRVATLDKRLMLKQINATLDHAIKTIDAKMEEGDKWITTESGSHILVDGQGNIKGGAGGKFNGKPLNSMGGTKKFTKYETVKEREAKASQSTNPKFSYAQEDAPRLLGATGGKKYPAKSSDVEKMTPEQYTAFVAEVKEKLKTAKLNRQTKENTIELLKIKKDTAEFLKQQETSFKEQGEQEKKAREQKQAEEKQRQQEKIAKQQAEYEAEKAKKAEESKAKARQFKTRIDDVVAVHGDKKVLEYLTDAYLGNEEKAKQVMRGEIAPNQQALNEIANLE